MRRRCWDDAGSVRASACAHGGFVQHGEVGVGRGDVRWSRAGLVRRGDGTRVGDVHAHGCPRARSGGVRARPGVFGEAGMVSMDSCAVGEGTRSGCASGSGARLRGVCRYSALRLF